MVLLSFKQFESFLKLVCMIDCVPGNIFDDQSEATKCPEEVLNRIELSA